MTEFYDFLEHQARSFWYESDDYGYKFFCRVALSDLPYFSELLQRVFGLWVFEGGIPCHFFEDTLVINLYDFLDEADVVPLIQLADRL